MKRIPLPSAAIALIWILVLTNAATASNPTIEPVPTSALFTPSAALKIVAMPVLFFGAMSFWAQHSPFYHPALARFIDGRFGEGAYARFLVGLKPLLLLACAAIIRGGLDLLRLVRADAPLGACVFAGFFVSYGIGFALAHLLLHLRRVTGVYPAEGRPGKVHSEEPPPGRKPLDEALPAHWTALIGVALFPSFAVIGTEFLRIPFEYMMLPFFGVTFWAAWPYLSGRATYAFWLVALLVYMAGGIFAALLGAVMRAALT